MGYLETALKAMGATRVIAPVNAPPEPDPASWSLLRDQRWGDDPTPGVDHVGEAWRWSVAQWPHDRWLRWVRLASQLEPSEIPPGADPETRTLAIRRAEKRAYDEIMATPEAPHR